MRGPPVTDVLPVPEVPVITETQTPDNAPAPTEGTPSDDEFANDYVKSIKLSSDLDEGEEVRVGDRFDLYAEITPEELEDTEVIWSTSNKKIATVTNKGVVKGVKKGKTTITVKANGKTVKVKVTVK